jgi:hypothetical protein
MTLAACRLGEPPARCREEAALGRVLEGEAVRVRMESLRRFRDAWFQDVSAGAGQLLHAAVDSRRGIPSSSSARPGDSRIARSSSATNTVQVTKPVPLSVAALRRPSCLRVRSERCRDAEN